MDYTTVDRGIEIAGGLNISGVTRETSETPFKQFLITSLLVTLTVLNFTAHCTIFSVLVKSNSTRRCRNIYLLSLAISDFLTGFTMPISILETLNMQWTFSRHLCPVFLVLKYSFLFVSLLNIILLTVDRWWMINFPFSYRANQSRKKALILVTSVWIFGIVVHIPIILVWNALNVDAKITYCVYPYAYDNIFAFCVTFIKFFLPITVLVALNIAIYIRLAKRRNMTTIRRSISTNDSAVINRKLSSDFNLRNVSLTSAMTDARCHMVSCFPPNVSNCTTQNRDYMTGNKKPTRSKSLDSSSLLRTYPKILTRKQSDDLVKDFLVRQDKRAVFSLGILTLVAILCRAPYIIAVILSVSGSGIPGWIFVPLQWLYTCNATINPFLYVLGYRDIRKVLKSWIKCDTNRKTALKEVLTYCQLLKNGEIRTTSKLGVYRNCSL